MAAAIAAAALAALAGRPILDAITAMFTAVSAGAAAVAAYQARNTARESRQALALHYKPVLNVEAEIEISGPEPVLVWWLRSWGPEVTEVCVRWGTPHGPVREASVPADGLTQPRRLENVKASQGAYPAAELTLFEVLCTDVVTRNRWVARLPTTGSGIQFANSLLDYKLVAP